jgi:cytochrome c-type biogenesis protein CcsB
MKIFNFLFSGKFMGILLVIFGISIGYATFIENDFDAKTAKLLIYNAWWFEAVLVLMIVNFSGMIFTKKLYRKSKWNILLMHIAFIIIIIGAGVTRYFGFEGQMHIRSGESSNKIRTYDDYVNISIKDNEHRTRIYEKIILAPINKNLYKKDIQLNNKNIRLEIESFRPNMRRVIQADPNGVRYLSLMTAGNHGRGELFLRENDKDMVEGMVVSFGDTTGMAHVQFVLMDTTLMIRSSLPIQPTHMGVNTSDPLEVNTFHPVSTMQIYQIGTVSFVFRQIIDKANLIYMPPHDGSTGGESLIDLKVTVEDNVRHFMVKQGNFEQIIIDDIQFTMNIGNQVYTIPFELKLNKFELERYPGSQSPSSFASDIVLIDKNAGEERPFRIFMNNVLDYKGYRFYQSSYDQDEQGTVLSVNHDYWGTLITYIGYTLLFVSLTLSLFTPNTRFARLTKQMNEVHALRKTTAISVVFLLSFLFFTDNANAQTGAIKIDKEFAESFGKLLVQNKDGRVIPLNTIANNSLVKIYKKTSFEKMNADQVFLGMLIMPDLWQNKPMIKIYEADVQKLIGIKDNFASYNDFFNERGIYKLKSEVDRIYAMSPALRSKIDKEIINVDERVNVSNMVYNGSLFRVYPIPDNEENTWVSLAKIRIKDTVATNRTTYLDNIRETISKSITTGNYQEAEKVLSEIKDHQQKYGKAIIPSETKLKLEIFYNEFNIFKRLFPIYMTIGLILLGMFIIQLFKPSLEFNKIIRIFYMLLMAAFVFQTFGLGLRWYISGHAPWSDGYESMIYIAWATMLAGFIFYKKSPMTLSATTILAGITLLTAHMSWLNPEITNLVPVLKSYWLTFHVATITASYGFFGLASMIGIINLIIMIFRNQENHERINLKLKELTIIIEMSLMVGLILLVIGNFLGGIWANESWGRYWGWDPKETWSLVTIIVYTFILHMRLIPGMRNLFSINFMAHIGFGAVLMTYFGVNYYLSGLHSYAQGDPVPVPSFIFYMIGGITIVSVLAVINDISLKNKLEVQGELSDESED